MIIKHQISFKLRPYGAKKIVYQIQLHATYNGERLVVSTGCQIDSTAAWDQKAQSVVASYAGFNGNSAIQINDTLRNCRDRMEWAFQYFGVNDIMPSKAMLSDKYSERAGIVKKPKADKPIPAPPPSFFEVYDKFMKDCGEKNAWTTATFEKMNAMKVDLMTFKHDITFDDLDEDTLTDFVVYMRDKKVLRTPRKRKEERDDDDIDDTVGLKNSTIGKKLGYLRWFLNWATKRGYNSNKAYTSFKPTLKNSQKKVIYLTKEEIQRIRDLDLSGNLIRLEPIRDIFLFCCFSGLRHSDVSNLRRSDLLDDHFEITIIKTADKVSIELNNMTRSILDKYKDIQFKGDKALPCYTNQAMNRELKELCRLAGINEKVHITTYKGSVRNDVEKEKWQCVGTHTGRRTFIVNALSLGIPPNVVMKWTGHSDYKAMKPYIDIVDKIKSDSMARMNEIL